MLWREKDRQIEDREKENQREVWKEGKRMRDIEGEVEGER